MCVTTPARIISVRGDQAVVRTARGQEREVSLLFTREAPLSGGAWVLLNENVAVEIISEKEAADLISLLAKPAEPEKLNLPDRRH